MNILEFQGLLVQFGLLVIPFVLPGADITEVLVIAHRLAVRGLVLDPEVPAAGFLAVQGIPGKDLAEFEEIGHPSGIFELLVDIAARRRSP